MSRSGVSRLPLATLTYRRVTALVALIALVAISGCAPVVDEPSGQSTGQIGAEPGVPSGDAVGRVPHVDLLDHYQGLMRPIASDDWHLHDPSSIIELQGRQVVAVTGKENVDGYRCGLETWSREYQNAPWKPDQCLFAEKPRWVVQELPDNDGAFWAPDLSPDGTLVYSVANGFDQPGSCVGAARWNGRTWVDIGGPITCAFNPDESREVEAIDPTLIYDRGQLWLVVGGGVIHATPLDREMLQPSGGVWWQPGAAGWFELATGPGSDNDYGWVEAAQLVRAGQWVYLFVNWGQCCRGLDSTYEIRMGRASTVEGPFVDRDGRPLLDGGGSLLAASDGEMVGPGHLGIRSVEEGSVAVSFHFYDRARDGLPWLGEATLQLVDGWPEVVDVGQIVRPTPE